MESFDELLLRVIDTTIRYTFEDTNAEIIYGYLERKGCGLHEIPTKLNVFSEELRNILGSSPGQLLGVAQILEEAILELLCAELKTEFDRRNPASFADQVKKLRGIYNNRRDTFAQPIYKSGSQENDSTLAQSSLQTKGGESCCK